SAVLTPAASPALDSFPTRRSSDLQRGRRPRCALRSSPPTRHAGRSRLAGVAARLPAHSRHAPPFSPLQRRPLRVLFPVQQPAALDRKSTRLNSSHVAISYAVFCLK